MESEDFSVNELHIEHARARKMAALCEKHGEADGANAARAQERALDREIESLT